MRIEENKNIPELRFPEFENEWTLTRLGKICLEFKSGFGITSSKINEKGKFPVYGGNGLRGFTNSYTHDGFYLLIGRQGALCGNINTVQGKVYISEHAIAVRANKNSNTQWLAQKLDYINLNRFSESSAQPGLAANKLVRIKIFIPSLPEQQKIASFLSAVDDRIRQLTHKKKLLEQYKKGVMQKLFKQEVRFKQEDGSSYPAWQKRKFSDILFEHGLKSTGNEEVFSVSVHKGLINQIEHLGRSFAASSTNHYNLVKPNDIVYTKSPTGDFPLGIIKQSKIDKDVIVSPLYGVFTPETPWLGYMLNVYFESPINTHNYLASIIQKGAKNTINITNKTFLSKKLLLPVSIMEQEVIGKFLMTIDKKIEQVSVQLEKTREFKKGLLQQMFV